MCDLLDWCGGCVWVGRLWEGSSVGGEAGRSGLSARPGSLVACRCGACSGRPCLCGGARSEEAEVSFLGVYCWVLSFSWCWR